MPALARLEAGSEIGQIAATPINAPCLGELVIAENTASGLARRTGSRRAQMDRSERIVTGRQAAWLILGALLLGCQSPLPPPPPSPPQPYRPSVPLAVLNAKPEEPNWRFLRTRQLRRAKVGIEFPSELELELVATEPEIGALVVRPTSWRGKRAVNYLADRKHKGLFTKTKRAEGALAFRIYLAFEAPGPARIPQLLPDALVPPDHENMRPRISRTPFINNRIADIGLTVDSCEDAFFYQYEVTEGARHQYSHIEGSGWIVDPMPDGPASHALLLLAEGFRLDLARPALAQPSPTPAAPPPSGTGAGPTPPAAAPGWYCTATPEGQ